MKFVCTECDEPMKFDQNGGLDEDGSLSVSYTHLTLPTILRV